MNSIAGFDTRLLEHFTAAVIVTDPDGLIIGWNRAAEQTYGWAEEQVIGQSIVDVLVAPDHASLAAQIIDRLNQSATKQVPPHAVHAGP